MAYNGWSNYETWLVNLWMDNEPGERDMWLREAAAFLECEREDLQSVSDVPFEESDVVSGATNLLADHIRQSFDEALEGLVTAPGVFGDLLNGAMSEVNWHEIAKQLMDSALEQKEV